MYGELNIWDHSHSHVGISILIVVDYVSKWVEALKPPASDAKTVIKLFNDDFQNSFD